MLLQQPQSSLRKVLKETEPVLFNTIADSSGLYAMTNFITYCKKVLFQAIYICSLRYISRWPKTRNQIRPTCFLLLSQFEIRIVRKATTNILVTCFTLFLFNDCCNKAVSKTQFKNQASANPVKGMENNSLSFLKVPFKHYILFLTISKL